MSATTTTAAAVRRREVDELACRGLGAWAISKALRCDLRTVQRDLAALAAARRAAIDLGAERARLLEAARLVEAAAWKLYAGAGGNQALRLGALAKALAAQAQAVTVLRELAGSELEHRLAALEAQVAGLALPEPEPGAPTPRGTTNGHAPLATAGGGSPW